MADPAAATAELDVGAALDPALGQRGVDVMDVEAAEHFAGLGRGGKCERREHRRSARWPIFHG